jgi:uncharacterized membrane protein
MTSQASAIRSAIAAGTLLGIGMGGFVDGILFHQILQLHNMLSNWVPRDTLVHEQINMFWDGLFHAFTWLTTAIGIWLLWHTARHRQLVPSGRMLAGSLLLGWGAFNLIEGLIDHEVLQVHHVFQNGNHMLWDMVFLASGVLFLGAGYAGIRSDLRPAA